MTVAFILTLSAGILFLLFYASYSMRWGVYLKSLCRNPKRGRVVALTFDDGPNFVQTPKVLDVLKEYNVKACFFCIGKEAENNKELLKRISDEGHVIGNHSYNHTPSFPILSVRGMVNDLKRCGSLLEEVTGKKTQLFRPPYGVTNPTVAKAVKKLGYITVGWNIRSLDTSRTQEATLKRIKRRLKDGSVILLHDRMPFSHNLLKSLLEYLAEQGYEVVGLDELFNLKIS